MGGGDGDVVIPQSWRIEAVGSEPSHNAGGWRRWGGQECPPPHELGQKQEQRQWRVWLAQGLKPGVGVGLTRP